MKPLFISVDGSDGSGKSTMISVLKEEFKAKGYDVLITNEPGGTPIARQLREILVNEDKEIEPIDKVAQLLMLYSARIQHIKEFIIPQLTENTVIISDRYIDSTYVYQGHLFGLNNIISEMESLHGLSFLSERPDYTFFMDVDYLIASNRANSRGNLNSMDKEYLSKKMSLIQKFRNHFQRMQEIHSKRMIKIIDANNDLVTVTKDLQKECVAIFDDITNGNHKTYLERLKLKQ